MSVRGFSIAVLGEVLWEKGCGLAHAASALNKGVSKGL